MCTAVHMRSCTEVQGPRMTCLLTAWRIELLPINVWWYLSPGDVLSDCKRSPHRQKEERSPLSSVHRVVITTFCQCSLQQVGDHTHMIRSYTLLSSDRACDVEIKNDRAQVWLSGRVLQFVLKIHFINIYLYTVVSLHSISMCTQDAQYDLSVS